ncbi:DUF4294 domain-containing protein [Chitinophaga sancti]|uniref:DUF4294 domain-containing protein n=1 Tax=Chitinophaga sancti TaxID=1004 RepID=A0A1K1MLN7_9BACT|nr:DUF4294 domain-containing protein [Chitinophaga sancti]WQD62797.1 DUF4294 domain-containing protein [Chitinophaga sancti]WQG91579.1 DUF4294 domain-containing protein [Chitinophaga sancti]SFW24082.1 protein of unknown function [Chitinophaga sancti]
MGRSISAFFILIMLCLFSRVGVNAQTRHGLDSIPVSAVIINGDTIPSITLQIVEVIDKLPKKFRKQREAWTRLRNAVYVTYPYAVQASRILKDVNSKLAALHDKKDRKAYLASVEKQMKAQFGDKLENLSIYQGRILMKLINRQTGQNCYEIIKELKGGFSARMWQTVAFFFGGNLKSEYDLEEDKDIEAIVQEIEIYRGSRAYN